MTGKRQGQTAVIFVSQRTDADAAGYAEAAEAMDRLAARQPGYAGVHSVRDVEGLGITISYWQDEASALAWRANAEHSLIRDTGRACWYEWYEVIVTEVGRDYQWRRP